jgi:hypothetical protein
MSLEVLYSKFAYNVADSDNKRTQSLRNAYIHFGFMELKNLLKTLEISDSVMKDLAFLDTEERDINA